MLTINPNTVARAYGELVREGVADAQAGRGLFVATRRAVYSDEERERRLASAVEAFAQEVILLGYSHAEIVGRVETRLAKVEDISHE